MSHVLVNLSYLNQQPTGLMTYGVQIAPYVRSLPATLLLPESIQTLGSLDLSQPSDQIYRIPENMTADQGSRGHLRRLLWTQFKLPQLVRQLDASLLFSPIPEAPLGIGRKPYRLVVTVHDLIPLRFPKRFSPLTLYSQHYVPQVLHQADHILTNSKATADDVTKFFGISSQKMTPIPLAYDQEHFRVLDLPTQPYFLYLGRPDPHKNVSRIIEAFAKLPISPEVELWLAGTPDPVATPALLQQAEALGVGNRVKQLDYVPYADLPKLLNQAIALVFPSLWEGFGLPVLEAMACGTPVITSNLSSLPEVAGDAALLVDPYRVDEIAHAMKLLLVDAEARSHLREAGLRQVQQFSWEKTGTQTAEVLHRYCS
ncbi:MAG: glycosyltransferase family 1 protein [Elainellaceae cyanobacterium]